MGAIKQFTNIGEKIFFLAISLETLFVLLDKSAYIIHHETWWFRLTFLLFCCKIAVTKYSKREWLCLICFVLLGVISWYYSDREEIIRIVAFVAACKGIDRKKIFKVVLIETVIGTLMIMALAFLGVLGSVSVTGMFRGGGIEETRYTFGMGHPNAFHCMMMMIILLVLAVYEEQMKWYWYVAFGIANLVIYYFSDSRTSALITMVMVIFACFLHYGKKIRANIILYLLAELFLYFCVRFSLYVSKWGVTEQIMLKIDRIFNGRFQWAYLDGGIWNWSLFSKPENNKFFDMAYSRFFYWYGWIPAAICLIVLAIVIWKCRELKAYDAFLVIMTLVAYSLFEAHVVSTYIGRNYALICVGTLLPAILNGFMKKKIDEYCLIDIGKVWRTKWKKISK